MAYDASQDQEEDANQQSGQGNPAGGQASTQLSGGGGGFAGQGSSPQASGAPGTYNQQPTSSGNWTNLNSYLSANADQAPAVGQSIANTVGSQARQAQGDLSQVQQGFQNQAPYQQINQTTTNDVNQAFSNPSQYAGSGAQATTTPENYLNDNWGINSTDNNITNYGATTTNADGSTTPSSVSGPTWNTVQNDYLNANQTLQDTQSESGRDTLLQNQYGSNGTQYNQGEQNFDQLLLNQTPQNQQALNSVYNQYAPGVTSNSSTTSNPTGMPTDLYNAEQGANSYVTGEQNQATGIQTQAQQALAAQIAALGTSVTGEAAAANSGYSSTYQQLASDLAAGKLNSSEIQALGLPLGIIDTYGVSPTQFLGSAAVNPYTDNSAATTQDWNNLAGLQALIGGETGTDQATEQSNLAGIGLTGTQASQSTAPAIASPYSDFNTTNFNSAVQTAQTGYKQSLSQEVQAMEQATGTYGSADRPAQGSNPDQFYNYYTNYLQSGPGQAFAAQDPQGFSQLEAALQSYKQTVAGNTYLDAGADASPTNPLGIAPVPTPTSQIPSGPNAGTPIAPVGPKTPIQTSPIGETPVPTTPGPELSPSGPIGGGSATPGAGFMPRTAIGNPKVPVASQTNGNGRLKPLVKVKQ